jgi:UDP-glucose 4-epimerase
MVRVLITGKHSFVGNGIEKRLLDFNEQQGEICYEIHKISVRGENWKNTDFSHYDVMIHVAGIAHADVEKIQEEEQKEYYRVNCDLAVEVAKYAKSQGVKQFIYLSSILVYGASGSVGKKRVITKETVPQPENFYGRSKLMAEIELRKLQDECFVIDIIRSPVLYGEDCKGNYQQLRKIAHRTKIFPEIHSERSMLYIENLGEFVRLLMERRESGIFFPQNKKTVATSDLVKQIGEAKGKKIALWKCLNPFVRLASKMPGKIGKLTNKAFGNLVYDQGMSIEIGQEYQLYSFEESIRRTERDSST